MPAFRCGMVYLMEEMVIIFIIFVVILNNNANASSLDSQAYFKKVRSYGDTLDSEDIILSHIVNSELECSLKCLEEKTCVGHNYRPKSTKYEYNCQLASNSSLEREKEIIRNGEWVFSQDVEFLPTYEFDPFTWKNEWTLIARFSNDDSKHWTKDGSFWYDRVIPYGDVNNPLGNTDMISEAFWTMKAREIKITRSDDSSHTALLQTTSNCLQGETFRSKITSYGDFRYGKVWASDKCLGNCPVTYDGPYETTEGFKTHNCSSGIQNSSYIGFWCDWDSGDGAVMMIGGGGASCYRADHGIGITEENAAKFSTNLNFDFGNDASTSVTKKYSLNLWVR